MDLNRLSLLELAAVAVRNLSSFDQDEIRYLLINKLSLAATQPSVTAARKIWILVRPAYAATLNLFRQAVAEVTGLVTQIEVIDPSIVDIENVNRLQAQIQPHDICLLCAIVASRYDEPASWVNDSIEYFNVRNVILVAIHRSNSPREVPWSLSVSGIRTAPGQRALSGINIGTPNYQEVTFLFILRWSFNMRDPTPLLDVKENQDRLLQLRDIIGRIV